MFRGLPIEIAGEAAADGEAGLRVWVTPAGYPEAVLLECTASGQDEASCSGKRDVHGLARDLPPQTPHLVFLCNVAGEDGGTYACSSNEGR